MNNKALVFSDLHVHNYKQFNPNFSRIDNAVNMIEYVFKFAAKNEIELILFTGDLCDQFANVSVVVINRIINKFDECFNTYENIEFLAIPGNHDFATKSTAQTPGLSIMDELAARPTGGLFSNFSLLNGTYISIEDGFSIMGIPFYENIDDFWQTYDENIDHMIHKDNMFLMMHQMVWPENTIVPDDVNINDNRLKQFKWIFNGHVHHKGIHGNNFMNVGSPLHRDASDVGTRKGIWVVDLTPGPDTMPKFWDTTDRNPQFIRKAYDEPVSDWDKEQYIIWYHPEGKKKKNRGEVDSAKFNTKLSPQDLVTNYCKEVAPDDEDLLKVGLKLLS